LYGLARLVAELCPDYLKMAVSLDDGLSVRVDGESRLGLFFIRASAEREDRASYRAYEYGFPHSDTP
jgi:hypothetical protein